MKKLQLIVLFASSFLFYTGILNAQENNVMALVSDETFAVAQWDKTVTDFGKIKQNVPAEAVFTLTNKGNTPLIIKDVQTSCGCTVPNYTKEPVMPGNSTVIKAVYNAKNPGNFAKTVTVKMNTAEGLQVLTLKGVVE